MPPCRFRRSVILEASAETVFRFHADPHNVGVISPGFQRIRVLEAEHTARVGEEFALEVRFFGLPLATLRWRGVWRAVRVPELLEDEALRSPFALFRHRHEFVALGAHRTRMTDIVTYQLPGGWVGKLLGETFGRAQFALMFADRHRRTRRWAHSVRPSGPS